MAITLKINANRRNAINLLPTRTTLRPRAYFPRPCFPKSCFLRTL